MEFESFVPSNEDKQAAKQAAIDEITARHTAALRKELHQQGVALLHTPKAARVAAVPVTQTEYDCRLYSLLHIIRNLECTEHTYPLSTVWKELYPAIPYNDKATNWNISKVDKDKIVGLMKELKIYRRFKCDTVNDVLTILKLVHNERKLADMSKQLQEQENRIAKYEFMLNGADDTIVYRGHVLTYSSHERAYFIKLGDKKYKISKGNIEKLQLLFDTIDMFEDNL